MALPAVVRWWAEIGENGLMAQKPTQPSPDEALKRLREGNARFVNGLTQQDGLTGAERRSQLADSQRPFAVILGCSDSRVPAEMVFDQGLGDLFVIRVAGNVVAESQIGSIEFAASKFGCPVVVVLGHSGCGAVTATLEELRQESQTRSPNLGAIVDFIRPSVQPLLETLEGDESALIRAGVRANIHASVEALRSGSQMLDALMVQGDLTLVAAEYCLETGSVEFLAPA